MPFPLPAVPAIIILMLLLPRIAYLNITSGMVAKRVCSEIFVAGRDPKGSYEEENLMFGEYTSFEVDEKAKTVEASTLGFWSQVAAWHKGFGCTLVRDSSVEEIQKQTLDILPRADTNDLPWPLGDRLSEQTPQKGLDRSKLKETLDWAFEEADPNHIKRTRAVIVLYRGDLVAERYAEGFGRETPFLGWSLAKSVTHGIIGVAVQKGLTSIDQPAGFSEWQYEEREHITLDHLLRMSTGIEFDEWPTPGSDLTDMLYLSHDMAKRASEEDLEVEPGTRWAYSSGTSIMVMRVLREILRDKAYHRFPYEALFNPIGISSAIFETDPVGNFVSSSYLYMTARDWARFSLLYTRDGIWNGVRILPKGWVKYGCTPSPASAKSQYGAHWWVNGGENSKSEDRTYPKLPGNLCYASGFEDQLIAILPDQELVILRFGVTPDPSAFDVEKFILKVINSVTPVD